MVMGLARTAARYRALLARSWRWEVSRAGGGVLRTSPVAVAASGARWREGRRESGSGPADQRRRGRLGEREAAAREPGGTCGGGGGGGSRGAGSRNRFGAGEGRRVRAGKRLGQGGSRGARGPLPWSGQHCLARCGGHFSQSWGWGLPSPTPAPAAEGRRAGVGAGGARRFVLRLARVATWAAEVELSRVGVEGEQAGQWEVMRGRCGCLDLFLLFKGYEECCLFSPLLSSPPEL